MSASYYSVWVGKLKGVVQEKDLASKFSQYGRVLHVKVPRDAGSSKSRHYGFVVFEDEYTAEQAAIHANKTEMYGRAIVARGPEEQRSRGYSGEYDGKIRRVPTIDNDKRQLIDCKYYPTGSCTNGSSCPYRHRPICALEECTEPCHVDDDGTVHECCNYNHAMEHTRRTEEEMDRKLLIKGVTHCFLPGCHLVPLPFMNYCSKTHAEIGGESGLLPPKLPEYQKKKSNAKGHAGEIAPLISWSEVKAFLSSRKFEVVENAHAKPGGTLYERFMTAKATLPQEYQSTCLAFHGTPEENIPNICEKGYDAAKRKRKVHGPGEYFAITPEIPLKYCGGGKKMLLNELLLGKVGVHHTRPTKNQGIIVMKNPEHELPRFIVTVIDKLIT